MLKSKSKVRGFLFKLYRNNVVMKKGNGTEGKGEKKVRRNLFKL